MTVTREYRLEEIEKAIAELRAAQAEAATKQATSDMKLDAILAKLNISDPTGDPSKGSSETSDEALQIPMLQKMELPSFDGSEARAWLPRAEQYFLVHKVPVMKRVELAVIALSGSSMSWYQLLIRRIPNPDWDTFRQELVIRYGDESAFNGYESLLAIKQTGSLEDYISAFENRISQLPDFSDQHFTGFFLGNLNKHLRAQIPDSVITTYSTALQAARKLDRASSSTPLASSRLPPSHTTYSSQSLRSTISQRSVPGAPQGSSPDPSTGSSPSKSVTPTHNPRKFREMSKEEYKQHIKAGTCFKCGGKFSPTHCCPPHTLNVLIGGWEDDVCADDSEHEASELHDSPGLKHKQPSGLTMDGLDGFG